MKTFLKAQNIWEVVEHDVNPPELSADPIVAHIKKFETDRARKRKALTHLHFALSDNIFTRIMAYETPKDVWHKLKTEFDGLERVDSQVVDFKKGV